MLTDFEKYNEQIDKFESSKLYREHYQSLITSIKDKPTISKRLEGMLRINGAEIRSLVRHARLLGIPLCSSNDGYYMAGSYDDLKKTTSHLKERAHGLIKTAEEMEKAWLVTKGSGQMNLL